MSLIVGCLLRTLAPLLTYFFLNYSVAVLSITYGLLNGVSNNIILLGILQSNEKPKNDNIVPAAARNDGKAENQIIKGEGS